MSALKRRLLCQEGKPTANIISDVGMVFLINQDLLCIASRERALNGRLMTVKKHALSRLQSYNHQVGKNKKTASIRWSFPATQITHSQLFEKEKGHFMVIATAGQ